MNPQPPDRVSNRRAVTKLLLSAAAAAGACRPAAPRKALPAAAWVWGCDELPSDAEVDAWRAAGFAQIYWQAAELTGKQGAVIEQSRFPLPPFRAGQVDGWCVPVIRIASGTRLPDDLPAAAVARWIQSGEFGGEVQLDYDCPDRRLPDYAAWLRELKRASGVERLSTTALGAWAMQPGWPEVAAAVDEVFPMLYDVRPERPPRGDGRPDAEPLVDAVYVAELLQQWSRRCPIPWRVGLPNFRRLSLFRDGRALGQIRNWSWEDFLDEASWELLPIPDSPPGVEFLRCRREMLLGSLRLRTGDVLAVKACDPVALRQVLDAIPDSGAGGVSWFQLPRRALAANGWSLPMMRSGFTGRERTALHWDGKNLWLRNVGDGDLPPRLPSGHVLRINVAPGAVSEVIPGEFASVRTMRDGAAVPAGFATEIEFRFPALAAGSGLRSGTLLVTAADNPLVVSAWLNEDAIALTCAKDSS